MQCTLRIAGVKGRGVHGHAPVSPGSSSPSRLDEPTDEFAVVRSHLHRLDVGKQDLVRRPEAPLGSVAYRLRSPVLLVGRIIAYSYNERLADVVCADEAS